MVSVHQYSADCHDQDATADNDQCVGEELRARIGLQVVPSSAKRCEYVDEKQREDKQEYQINSDIVLSDIVIRYLLA